MSLRRDLFSDVSYNSFNMNLDISQLPSLFNFNTGKLDFTFGEGRRLYSRKVYINRSVAKKFEDDFLVQAQSASDIFGRTHF